MAKRNKKPSKSIFLYGKQNVGKVLKIKETIKVYNDDINNFIDLLIETPETYLSIFNNNSHSSILRQLEEKNRNTLLGSAYSQNAEDHAVIELHNHFSRIKDSLCKESKKNKDGMYLFYNSICLLNACLINQNPIEAVKDLICYETLKISTNIENKINKQDEKIKDKNNKKETIYETSDEALKRHIKIYSKIKDLPTDEIDLIVEKVRFNFCEKLYSWKRPYVKNAPLQLDSRTYSILRVHNLKKYCYVISVKLLGNNSRINLPFNTSTRGKRRLNMYKNCSPKLSLSGKNIKLTLPVESDVKKETNENKIGKMLKIGVDAGITKLFSLSNGKTFGSFKGLLSILEKLENKEANRSTLRNKMKEYQKELKSIKNKSWKVTRCDFLRKKIFNIAKSLQGHKKADKFKRIYAFHAGKAVSTAVKELVKYIRSIDTKVLVVLEDLNIDEIDNNSKKQNKRVSSWARGKMFKKLLEAFDWYGINYKLVNPSYTSQCCPVCNYVSKENRKYETFKCKCCGHTADADVNAGVNIENRADDYAIEELTNKYWWNKYLLHEKIKEVLMQRNLLYRLNS